MSNILLWWLNRKSTKLDTNKWPVGGARLETIGNICYGTGSPGLLLSIRSTIGRFLVRKLDVWAFPLLISKRMFSVNLVVIVESIHSIATHKAGDTDHFFIPAVASVASALGGLSTYPQFTYRRLTHPS